MPNDATPVTWPLADTTRGKHLVLREYLNAWLPIIGSRFQSMCVIDGFAGPGAYADGEPGSPVIALDCIARAANAPSWTDPRIKALFIERDAGHFNHLQQTIAQLTVPANTHVELHQGHADEHVNAYLSAQAREGGIAPTFAMFDPKGVSDVRMTTIGRLLARESTECMISFMYNWIHRFITEPNFGPHLDALFGTERWRESTDSHGNVRREGLCKLFESQLRANGARHVLSYQLWKGGLHLYSIYFATNNLLGCERMKDAIWKVIPDGSFQFRGDIHGQAGLDLRPGETAIAEQLGKQLSDHFRGRGRVRIDAIETFVSSDSTLYRRGHLKKTTLRPMERAGQIVVHAQSSTRKKGSFPEGTQLEFV